MPNDPRRYDDRVTARLQAALLALALGLLGPPASVRPAPPAASRAARAPAASAAAPAANRLAGESSPYLLLHAGNPVDWYPWGPEAIETARREHKPIFLSIGYFSCYWCHVMEREVFSDPKIAALMNRWFVNVKVDREERPDLDEIYLAATQILTGEGGWPNSVFLTPDLEPFFAGSTFPPADTADRIGFPTLLRKIHEAWTVRRGELERVASQVAGRMRQVIARERQPATELPAVGAARRAVAELEGRFDAEWGGFGTAPKFPDPGSLALLGAAARSGDETAGRMLETTLERMGQGAIYDQLGGGFHRYALDRRWRVPHFEKMLYDNALLLGLLAGEHERTGDPELARLGRGTADFLVRVMALPGGGFASALDAETAGVEGAYYAWTTAQLEAAVGETGFALLAPIYGFGDEPGLTGPDGGRRTLYLTAPLAEHARRLGISRAALLARLEPRLAALRAAREARPRPAIDDKVLTDWNGLAIGGLARAGRAFGEPRYLEAARRAAGFVLTELRPPAGPPGERNGAPGPLLHAWRGGEAKIPAFLDDYAFLIDGLLALQDATGEARWLAAARELEDELESRLRDPAGGYFLAAPRPHLLFQPKSALDGSLPSGNGVAALDLLELARRTGEADYRKRAEAVLLAFGRDLVAYPAAVATLARARLAWEEATKPAPEPAAAPPGGSRR